MYWWFFYFKKNFTVHAVIKKEGFYSWMVWVPLHESWPHSIKSCILTGWYGWFHVLQYCGQLLESRHPWGAVKDVQALVGESFGWNFLKRANFYQPLLHWKSCQVSYLRYILYCSAPGKLWVYLYNNCLCTCLSAFTSFSSSLDL